jgi:two-component system, OmpR family, phosphate regulon sensor histidine kinase PhoR
MKAATNPSLGHFCGKVALLAALVLLAATVGVMVSWRLPGLELQARDWLMRWRGNLPPSEELVIVAIDEASLKRFGRFPWPRSLMAQALRQISAAQPKAIALDVLYSEPTREADDQALAAAIAAAGNVVVAAQLTEASDETGETTNLWLRPLPAIEKAAAGAGHVNVVTGFDGVARALLVEQADDETQPLWALALEALRVGEGARAVRRSPEGVLIGQRKIPVNRQQPTLTLAVHAAQLSAELIQAGLLHLDFCGPAGSFAPQTFSFGAAFDGRIPAARLRGKYVLIGATAAALGDRVASPFTRAEALDGRERNELMPGVEVLANALNTLLQARFYHVTPDWAAALLAALVAAAAICTLNLAQGNFEAVKQVLALFVLLGAVLLAAQLAFTRLLVFPPLVALLGALGAAALLALLQRALALSANIDLRIRELSQAGAALLANAQALRSTPDSAAAALALIARLSGAEAVALFKHEGDRQHYVKLAAHGARAVTRLKIAPSVAASVAAALEDGATDQYFAAQTLPPQTQTFALRLDVAGVAGLLVLACPATQPASQETALLCREIAAAELAGLARAQGAEAETSRQRWQWPRGGEWKARRLGVLTRGLLERAQFVQQSLLSVEDGLLIADVSGRITFANLRAAEILGLRQRALPGGDLFERLAAAEGRERGDLRETLRRLLIERAPVERELTLGDRHYTLRLAAVQAEQDETVLGLLATLADITKQRELQQARNDVMALVTHELKTPLTAIQGMTEVLAEFDAGLPGFIDAEKRREMHLAINDEAGRLARLIDDYLNITRLESGTQPLRRTPVRPAQIIERALLLLDSMAAQREIRLVRRLIPNLPALLLDADLLAQALTNLVSNALKYSPAQNEVIVSASVGEGALKIEVADHGCGIPAASLPHIFEKFYRVPRLEQADIPGAGLGLALVREIAELHGGRVTVESEVGVGSLFTLQLPLTLDV